MSIVLLYDKQLFLWTMTLFEQIKNKKVCLHARLQDVIEHQNERKSPQFKIENKFLYKQIVSLMSVNKIVNKLLCLYLIITVIYFTKSNNSLRNKTLLWFFFKWLINIYTSKCIKYQNSKRQKGKKGLILFKIKSISFWSYNVDTYWFDIYIFIKKM